MSTGSRIKSDLYALNKIVQNTMLSYPKELIISILREEYSKDSYYHFVADEFGFPKLPDLTNKDPEAGINDTETTRIYIGQPFKLTQKFYPSLIVKAGSSKQMPISLSRDDLGTVKYDTILVVDGYGNSKPYSTPVAYEFYSAWESDMTIDITAGSISERDDIVELTSALLSEPSILNRMVRAGVIVKPISIGTPSETDDRGGKLYKQSITLPVRSEYSKRVPVNSVINKIIYCIDLGLIEVDPPLLAPNIVVTGEVDLVQSILDL